MDGIFQNLFRLCTHRAFRRAIHGTKQESRHRRYAKNGSQFGFGIDVDFVKIDFPGILFRQFFQNGSHFSARTAPSGSKVDYARACSEIFPFIGIAFIVHDFFYELLLGEGHNLAFGGRSILGTCRHRQYAGNEDECCKDLSHEGKNVGFLCQYNVLRGESVEHQCDVGAERGNAVRCGEVAQPEHQACKLANG